MTLKIAIVNHDLIAIATLKTLLKTVPHYQVIWTANNGKEAIKFCENRLPDLILMDINMPLMNGVQATKEIMQLSPTAILIVTNNTKKHLSEIYQAMGYGALDAVDTPTLSQLNSRELSKQFLAKVATIRKLIPQDSPTSNSCRISLSLIAIGSSTGGPKALADILSHLNSNFKGAIIIVQHLDFSFSQGLVEWLNQQTPLIVQAAKKGDRPQRGHVLVAATNDHLYLKKDKTLAYTPNPQDYPYRPSVDVLFHSLANHWQGKGTGILLTGMGRDGAKGLKALRSQGWHTIAQDQDSCTVYGMPKAAIELDAALQILSPMAIARQLSMRQ